MLIEGFELRMESPRCHPGCEDWFAFARLSADIAAVLPYLNVRLDGAIYDQAAQALTWDIDGRAVAIRPDEIAVSGLADRGEAQAEIQRLVDLVNHIWEERNCIQPSWVKRQPLQPLAAYRLLPRQNCGACGVPTCLAFAVGLATGQAQLAACPTLLSAEYAASRERLIDMLAAAGLPSVPGGN